MILPFPGRILQIASTSGRRWQEAVLLTRARSQRDLQPIDHESFPFVSQSSAAERQHFIQSPCFHNISLGSVLPVPQKRHDRHRSTPAFARLVPGRRRPRHSLAQFRGYMPPGCDCLNLHRLGSAVQSVASLLSSPRSIVLSELSLLFLSLS